VAHDDDRRGAGGRRSASGSVSAERQTNNGFGVRQLPAMDADDNPRWWCPGGADGFQAVLTDWACHPGASPPMRMAASWSGSRIRRIQACGAGSAPMASSPRKVAAGRCSPQGSSESHSERRTACGRLSSASRARRTTRR
jgi:hypothetical protein